MGCLLAGLFAIGVLCAGCLGRWEAVNTALLTGGGAAIELWIELLGGLLLWGGILEVAAASGMTKLLSRGLAPLTRRLFPRLSSEGKAMQAISMNLSANLLGLGSAAVPSGLTAMTALEAETHTDRTAGDEMVIFVAMNTASMQLLPTTVATLRAMLGAAVPLDILPCVWICSAASVAAAVLVAKYGGKRGRKDGDCSHSGRCHLADRAAHRD